jgi:glycosyltransferase involved in cell wall biosynthesis
MRDMPHEGMIPRLLHVFPSFAVGGAQMRLIAVANHFGRHLDHSIIALDGDTAAAAALAPGLAVRFPALDARKGDTLGSVRRYAATLRTLQPDVLVTHNWGSIEWAMANALAGRRHVHIEDGFGPEERTRQLPRRVLTRRLVLRRATVVLPSRTLWRLATGTWRLPERRVRYVPNGIDLARFAPAPPDAAAAAPRAVPVIGTVAGLRPEKNVARLLRAVAALPAGLPARLTIVGEGPERPALDALAATLGIAERVTFAGHLAAPERAYREFDVFALSSDTEQMPLSVLEAMASGLAVAASDVGDVAEMLAAPNRRFVVPREDAALSAALAALLADPVLRHDLGAANRARAEAAFDQATMFAAYGGLFGLSPATNGG